MQGPVSTVAGSGGTEYNEASSCRLFKRIDDNVDDSQPQTRTAAVAHPSGAGYRFHSGHLHSHTEPVPSAVEYGRNLQGSAMRVVAAGGAPRRGGHHLAGRPE